MTMMGPGDVLLRLLAEGADAGSEVCLQEVVLQQRDCDHDEVKKLTLAFIT